MNRDKKLQELIKESGVVKAPEGFTGSVMDMLGEQPLRSRYKPLIGRNGRIAIILFIVAVVAVSLIYAEPGGRFLSNTGNLFEGNRSMPQWDISMDFLSKVDFSTGLVAGIVVLFFLVLTDEGLRRRKLV